MADAKSSFWGTVTSTSEWCEKNYVYSPYIAEFFNTTSSIPGAILAVVGLLNSSKQRFERRFSILYMSNLIHAIWNILHHATLHQLLQESDETPVVWEALLYIYILYSPDWHYHKTMPTFLILYGLVFAVVHSRLHFSIGFKVHFMILCLLCAPRMYKYYIYTEDLHAKRVGKLYAGALVLGTLCWIFDRALCNDSWPLVNPQGHALWHVFMGFTSYFANTFLMFCRAQQLRKTPKIMHWMRSTRWAAYYVVSGSHVKMQRFIGDHWLLQASKKKRYREPAKSSEWRTLEDYFLNSPAHTGDQVQMFSNLHKKVHPSSSPDDTDASQEFFTPRRSFTTSERLGKIDERDEDVEGNLSSASATRSGSGKLRKTVTFRLPEEADIFVYYSPKQTFEEVC